MAAGETVSLAADIPFDLLGSIRVEIDPVTGDITYHHVGPTQFQFTVQFVPAPANAAPLTRLIAALGL